MKGLDLPINILIIIAIAIIVLIAVVGMFYGPFSSGTGTVSLDIVKSTACKTELNLNCNTHPAYIVIRDFDADKDGRLDPDVLGGPICGGDGAICDNFHALCVHYYGYVNSWADGEKCRRELCGCTK
jgi:hypothetical protein